MPRIGPRRAALLGAAGLATGAVAAARPASGQGRPAAIAADSARPRAEWGSATGDVTADRALVWSRADRTAGMIPTRSSIDSVVS
jgi:alkaline phosphatase D